MAITSKEIVLLLLGLVGIPLLKIISDYFGFSIIQENLNMIIWVVMIITVVTFILYKKINEVCKEIEIQEEELKKLEEKLKIYEQLIELRAEDRYLKDKVLELEKRIEKYGNKK